MRILAATAPGYGLTLPAVPLLWAARAAGHEVLLATTSEMVDVAARAGLTVVDVRPERGVWDDLMRSVHSPEQARADLPEIHRLAACDGNPFGLFTLTMTEPTVRTARAFGADLVVYPADHAAGMLTAAALGVPALEVGNRISWSMRDLDRRSGHDRFAHGEVVDHVRDRLGLGDATPVPVARIDVRAPSMRGLGADEAPLDDRDGAPWWPMRFVPFNVGTAVPDLGVPPARPARPAEDRGHPRHRRARDERGLAHDQADLDAATLRASVERLLTDPAFARAAREVAAEMADQPSPAAFLDRTLRAL